MKHQFDTTFTRETGNIKISIRYVHLRPSKTKVPSQSPSLRVLHVGQPVRQGPLSNVGQLHVLWGGGVTSYIDSEGNICC